MYVNADDDLLVREYIRMVKTVLKMEKPHPMPIWVNIFSMLINCGEHKQYSRDEEHHFETLYKFLVFVFRV